MVKSKNNVSLINQLGNPVKRQEQFEKLWMVLWTVPTEIRALIPVLPAKIYLNRIIAAPLEKVLRQLITEGLHKEIKTYDGCFAVRNARDTNRISHHAFGLATDMNAATNPLYGAVTWSEAFLNVWRENDWTCGADFMRRPDGMHFEYNAFTQDEIEEYLSSPK